MNPYKEHEGRRLIDAEPVKPPEKPAHLTEYVADLNANGRDEKYVYTVEVRLRRIFAGCEWKTLGQINPEDFSGWRNQAMKDGVLKRSSATTINQHFDTVSAFCNWCVEKNRLRRNPLLHPNTNQPLIDKVKGAKVRQRRALSDDAVARVLAAASEYNRWCTLQHWRRGFAGQSLKTYNGATCG